MPSIGPDDKPIKKEVIKPAELNILLLGGLRWHKTRQNLRRVNSPFILCWNLPKNKTKKVAPEYCQSDIYATHDVCLRITSFECFDSDRSVIEAFSLQAVVRWLESISQYGISDMKIEGRFSLTELLHTA